MGSRTKKGETGHEKTGHGSLKIALQAVNIPTDEEGFVALEDIGISKVFAESSEPRTLRIAPRSGVPSLREPTPENDKEGVVKVLLEHPILSYGMIEGAGGEFRFITIGCTGCTHYVVVRGVVSFTFYVKATSVTIEEAVFELLVNNLLKGPRIYDKTAAIIKDFFPRIMSAVHKDPVILNTIIRTAEKLDLPCRIYFDPDDHSKNMISVDGYVYGYNLNDYPKPQINRTLRVLEKQEKRDRRAQHRCTEHMNALERQAMIENLEKAIKVAEEA